jgi:hypothetical protein
MNLKRVQQLSEKKCSGLQEAEIKPCPTYNGSGKVMKGYGVICTELVEKVEKCPDCRDKGTFAFKGLKNA